MPTEGPRFRAPHYNSSTGWEKQGACADQELTGLFFSDKIADISAAKDICAECNVADTCLQQALERHEPWGVWGGQLFLNGKILAQKRPRGRPKTTPVKIEPTPVRIEPRKRRQIPVTDEEVDIFLSLADTPPTVNLYDRENSSQQPDS